MASKGVTQRLLWKNPTQERPKCNAGVGVSTERLIPGLIIGDFKDNHAISQVISIHHCPAEEAEARAFFAPKDLRL